MKTQSETPLATEAAAGKLSVKFFGVGNAGVAMTGQMLGGDFAGASFAAVNADAQSLAASAIEEKILLEKKLLRGLGTGGDPELGRVAAEEHLQKLKDACAGVQVVVVIAGLGGGAGTGISPVLARAARESGALVMALATLPFDCEGNRRQRQAREGLEQLKAVADGVICLPNQKVFKLIDENTSVVDTFRATTQLVLDGACGVWRLLMHKGLIEIHFDELCGLLRDCRGESCVAAVEVEGKDRAAGAMEKLFAHPLLDEGKSLSDADAVLVSVMGGPDLTMAEVNRVMKQINQHCSLAQVIMGAAIDESFRDKLAVTLIATKRGGVAKKSAPAPAAEDETPDFDTQLLEKQTTAKPASRFVPPAPTLSQEEQTQLLTRQAGTRQRKSGPRLKQTQLQLEIIHKGRFDKSEPTIHKGEDLDVPTFIRRGVALN